MRCCKKYRLPPEKHIVIVGAGFAGIKLAEEFMKFETVHFTLINLRSEFNQNVAGCRAGIQEGLAPLTLIPLTPAYGSHFMKGRVVSINPQAKTIELESGETIQYDVLVLCTGSGGPFPFKINPDHTSEEALEKYEACVTKVKDSSKFVVIGGGPTGTEMAAELATKYSRKSVTLVTSASHLIPDITTQKFKNKVRDMLISKGVKIIFGERVTNIEDVSATGVGPVRTDKGSVLEADCVFNCMGLKVNSDAYSNGLASSIDDRGRLRVNEFLQVDGYTDIFALGDCCDTNEAKLGYTATLHAEWLAYQLVNYFEGKKLKPYAVGGAPVQMILALGPDAGLGITKGGWIIPSLLCVIFKGRVLVPETWKQLKQKMPAS